MAEACRRDSDIHMAEVLAFQCAHAVPEGRPCAVFNERGGLPGCLCPFMVHTNNPSQPFVTPKCAEVSAQMWLKEIQWYREQEAKYGRFETADRGFVPVTTYKHAFMDMNIQKRGCDGEDSQA